MQIFFHPYSIQSSAMKRKKGKKYNVWDLKM